MKIRGVLLSLLLVCFSQGQQGNLRTLDALSEVQRSIEQAFKEGSSTRDAYHYEKARAYRDISVTLASEMDSVGSKLFALKSMEAVSRAKEGQYNLDTLEPIRPKDLPPYIRVGDLEDITSALFTIRANKGIQCTPKELAYSEAYYEALSYQLKGEVSQPAITMRVYQNLVSYLTEAKRKLEVAKREGLECYVGKREVVKEEEPQESPISTGEKTVEREYLMVPARVHFEFNSYTIKKEYIPLLLEVARILKENPQIRVRIEGYTDNIGSKEYNEKLAFKRAKAVADFLKKQGVPQDKIEIAGFGKEGYIAPNTTPIGRFTNRRADFIVIEVPKEE
ncbi:OmpA/MotB domain protein [Thermocrinis albus DSM 14484]|uniref:OmpA/MotB domain protein n=1 Tax=Thermocrinis albus (strain DSM 14484 / JCM 11386 / HI 11/12) TaxID=638303 RepID=D3SN02_THEAH|nr:OmpA family protein [Thermocrinis albus]ADC90132.1 OmpA/MotB domain protein [Thermocrinis albus DSM 14484]